MAEIEKHILKPDGGIPNSGLPLVLLKGALPPEARDGEGACALFKGNGWGGNWVWGVYDFWHFHTHGHEVLGCVSGRARIGFGGDAGMVAEMAQGDVVIIPAGVGHKSVEASDGFQVAGGYPPGQEGNIVRPGEMDDERIAAEIAKVEMPDIDPVDGSRQKIAEWWGGE
jgi:uncharacterized protein YjlB